MINHNARVLSMSTKSSNRSSAAKKAAATRKSNAAKKSAAAKKNTGAQNNKAEQKNTHFSRATTVQLKRIIFGESLPKSYSCGYCGTHSKKIHIDHIRAWIKSHSNAKSNLTPACKKCNLKKSSSTLKQWFERLEKNGGADKRRLSKIIKHNKRKRSPLAKKINSALKHLK